MLRSSALRALTLAALAALGSACATPAPPPAAFELTPISDAERELQTRVFATDDEAAVLAACIAVLRRHDFAAEDFEPALGVIVAYKDTESPAGRSRLRASIASQPAGEFSLEVQLRVTFQRVAWNPRGRETQREAVRDESEHAGFFREVTRELALPEPSAE